MKLNCSQAASSADRPNLFNGMIDEYPHRFGCAVEGRDNFGGHFWYDDPRALRVKVEPDRVGPRLGDRLRRLNISNSADLDPHQIESM